MGIAVGILLLCALEVEICLGKIPTSGGQTSQKTVAGTWVYNMPIFKLPAAKTMHMLSQHILAKNASIFTCSH